MKLLLTTNARLYKTHDGKYWTKIVYGYDFFTRYLEVFEEVRLVAHTEECSYEDAKNMLRVDGKNIEIYEVPFPHGKFQYLIMYRKIQNAINKGILGCDAAILRIPDQLAFQVYNSLVRHSIPIAVEVTSDSWAFFSPGSLKSWTRPFLRLLWHVNQKKICAKAIGTSYVTQFGLQERYPPTRALNGDGFTTFCTSANLTDKYFLGPKNYSFDGNEIINIIHVSSNIGNDAKGYSELITCLGVLQEKGIKTQLTLVGGGSLSKKTAEIAKHYGYNKRIRITGNLTTSEELVNELKNSDIFVFPSYREGLPRAVLEAMAAGLPCITTDLPGTRELLNVECLVPIKDTEMLIERLYFFITNPNELSRQSYINFERANEYHSEIIHIRRKEFYTNLRVKNSL